MGHIVSDSITDNNQGGRCACAFKDGSFVRRLELRQNNVLVVFDTEGHELYRDSSLSNLTGFAVRTLDAETSTFSGTLIVVAGGFSVDTGNSRVVTVVTSYAIQPPIWFAG